MSSLQCLDGHCVPPHAPKSCTIVPDSQNHRWVVFFEGPGAVDVPQAPTGFDDRTMSQDSARGDTANRQPGSNRTLTSVLTADVGEADVFGHLFDFSPTVGDDTLDAASLVEFTTGFSVSPFNYPTVQITSPQGGASIPGADGLTVTFSVEFFAIPASGVAVIEALSPSGNIVAKALVSSVKANGQGSAHLGTLPAGSYTIHAFLADPTGSSLDPPAQNSVSVSVF
jgi:hypothetical protein